MKRTLHIFGGEKNWDYSRKLSQFLTHVKKAIFIESEIPKTSGRY